MNLKRLLFSAASLVFALAASAQSYDLVLRGGRVVDGRGNPAFTADVAVKDGRVVAVGRVTGKAKQEIDAKGLVVAPGFIDVHTHGEDIDDLPKGENFVRMGVTTLVLGNCGSSKLNVGEFFKVLEKTNISPNVATLLGHGTIRSRVMGGSFMRPPSPEEMKRMKEYAAAAMKDGAVGMSTGLIYLPGTFAKTEEIIEVAKVIASYDGIYVSHMRSEAGDIYESMDELFRIAREAGIRAEISHIKLSGNSMWGQHDKVLAAIEKARAEGLDITQDQYAYTASSTGISQLIPDSAREGGKEKFLLRISDPEQKKKIVQQMKNTLKKAGRDNYDYAVIASYRPDTSLNGLSIVDAAEKKRGSKSLDDQIELILTIEKNGGAQGVFHSMSEGDLAAFMRHPNTMIASDSGVRKFGEAIPHPRGYGNNARVLGKYVREQKVLRLEDAVRKMTSLPATTFRLKDRGEIREGAWADLAVFDPATVTDSATFNDPHHYSTGFRHVFVNGVEVVKNDEHTGARPGKPLRHEPPPATAATAQ